MTQEQEKRLESLISHIRNNAIEIIDNQKLTNKQVFNALYQNGIKYLNDNSDQTIVDIGALALAHKIRSMM